MNQQDHLAGGEGTRADSDAGRPAAATPAAGRTAYSGSRWLRVFTLLTVIAGVLVLAAAAFAFSYPGVHHIVRAAGVRASLARYYPAVPDAVFVIACAAVLALRGARWWARMLPWLVILIIAGLVAAAGAVYATAINLPHRPTAATDRKSVV